ncbi:hypothetical protein [Prosthecobacter sp.]|uniref:hypothetical protein n=1 Tax=Prosthecobacter sp. TaxID=1965333 RepID=UPI003783FD29
MKMPMKRTLMLWGSLLAACATKPAPVKVAVPTKPAPMHAPGVATVPGDPHGARVAPGPDGRAQAVVPGPDGKARVLVTASGISLQRRPNGQPEVLEEPLEVPSEPMDMEKDRWEETLKEVAEGIRWSPSGTKICLLRLYKRGSDVAVYTQASHPAGEIELDLDVLVKAIEERYGDVFKMGRFYYISPKRWIDEDHLEIEFSGNVVPKVVPKVETSPELWGYYKGTALVEMGAKSGNVKGELKWEPLEKHEVF